MKNKKASNHNFTIPTSSSPSTFDERFAFPISTPV